MTRPPPRATLTDTLFPNTPLFRSLLRGLPNVWGAGWWDDLLNLRRPEGAVVEWADGPERPLQAVPRRGSGAHSAHPGQGRGAGRRAREGRRGAGRPGPRRRHRPDRAQPQAQRATAGDHARRGQAAEREPGPAKQEIDR